MAGETLLVLSGQGMPPFSVRGIIQTLDPIAATQFDKYKSTITCSDMDSPAFDVLRVGNWRRTVNGDLFDLSGKGSVVTVDCVSELAWQTPTGSPPSYVPSRTIVPGSERTANGFTFGRPRLTMGVINKSQETNEYGAVVSWSLELEEL